MSKRTTMISKKLRINDDKRTSYLKIIGSTYYLRARLPKCICNDGGELCFSLKTNDLQKASLAVKIFKLALKQSANLSRKELKQVILHMFNVVQTNIERSLSYDLSKVVLASIYANGLDSEAISRSNLNQVHSPATRSASEAQLKYYLTQNSISFYEQDPVFQTLCQRVDVCEQSINQQIQSRNSGDFEAYSNSIQKAAELQNAFFSSERRLEPNYGFSLPLLTELLEIFLEKGVNPDTRAPFSKNRKKQFKETFTEVLFFIGDKPVNQYTQDDLQQFFDLLDQTPKYRAKKKSTEHKSLEELLLREYSRDECVSIALRVKHLQRINQFFCWVIEHLKKKYPNEHTQIIQKSPTEGVFIPMEEKASEKAILTQDDLNTAFSPDKIMLYDYEYQFWLPLLSRVMGPRPEELCQSLIEDWSYSKHHKIWSLKINDNDDKKVKNVTAIREVPVPQQLIDIGFGEFLNQAAQHRTPKERLFSELYELSDYYCTPYCSWFNSEIINARSIPKKDNLKNSKSAYSMRHNFISTARSKELSFELIQQVVGHSSNKLLRATASYWHKHSIEEVFRQVSEIEYPELEHIPTYNTWRKARDLRISSVGQKPITGLTEPKPRGASRKKKST